MGLNVQPHKAMRALAAGNELLLGDVNGIFSCCDCGLCTFYACSFGMKPGKAMQMAKQRLMQSGIKPRKEVHSAPDKGIALKRVPTERLLARLDLMKYDRNAPYIGAITCRDVKIPLKMHIGAPDEPVVCPGMRVDKGDPIAKARGLGAHIHASIPGEVVQVTETFIEIRG